MNQHTPQVGVDTENSFRVRVYRVQPQETATALLLTQKMAGVIVHWKNKATGAILCTKVCSPANHSLKSQWRGYLPVCLYFPNKKANWYPTLLEITEHAELDLRGGFHRGQVWSFVKQGDAKSSPLRARYTGESLGGNWIPGAFDPKPLLRTVYHVLHEDFSTEQKNPMPSHTFTQAVVGAALKCLGDETGDLATAEEKAATWKTLKERLKTGKAVEE